MSCTKSIGTIFTCSPICCAMAVMRSVSNPAALWVFGSVYVCCGKLVVVPTVSTPGCINERPGDVERPGDMTPPNHTSKRTMTATAITRGGAMFIPRRCPLLLLGWIWVAGNVFAGCVLFSRLLLRCQRAIKPTVRNAKAKRSSASVKISVIDVLLEASFREIVRIVHLQSTVVRTIVQFPGSRMTYTTNYCPSRFLFYPFSQMMYSGLSLQFCFYMSITFLTHILLTTTCSLCNTRHEQDYPSIRLP